LTARPELAFQFNRLNPNMVASSDVPEGRELVAHDGESKVI